MRNLTTPLTILTLLAPATAFAQETVTLDELPEESAPAAAPAATAPVEAAPAPAEAAPAAAAPVTLDETGGAGASASSTAGFQASGTTAAAPTGPGAAEKQEETPAPVKRSPATAGRAGPGDSDTWAFSYSGYFRAPMRLGFGYNGGPQHIAEVGYDNNPEGLVVAHDVDGNVVGLKEKQGSIHQPVIPDDQYASWQFTGHNKKDWAEMFFSVGNGTVSGTLAVQGFQFTDASWKEDGAQFGIGQGWVEVDHDLGFENVNFNVKVGSFWSRYGMAGVYDAGEYDTYLIGRTHSMGGLARVDLALNSLDMAFEGGFGAKQPDPEMFNRARFTSVAHGHVFFNFPEIEVGLHGMHAWSAQEVVPEYPGYLPGSGGCSNDAPGAQCTINDDQINRPDGTEFAGGLGGIEGDMSVWGPEYPHGSQTILGIDGKFDFGLFGYLFAGYSYQILQNALVVDSAIESIHSLGAGNFNLGVVDNYLETPFCNSSAPNESCSNGNGGVGTILAQYELGLANFGIFPGDMDLKTKLYGMFNHVSVDQDIELPRLAAIYGPDTPDRGYTIEDLSQNGTTKFKFGADLEFFPLDFMSAGLRFDRLNPTSNKLLKDQGFAILSPRLTFRTKMVTHETITLQYSRYFYDQRQCQDSQNNVASPADDPYRPGSIYGGNSADTGLPLRMYCTQPTPSPPPPSGFGSHSNAMAPGNRGAPTLLPDENVIKLEASMWW